MLHSIFEDEEGEGILIESIPVQSEKVACDTIFWGSVTAATFQFPQPLFVGGSDLPGGGGAAQPPKNC